MNLQDCEKKIYHQYNTRKVRELITWIINQFSIMLISLKTCVLFVGQSSDHLVWCRSWQYTKRITPRSVVYIRTRTCDSTRMNSNIYNTTLVLWSIYYRDDLFTQIYIWYGRGIHPYQYTVKPLITNTSEEFIKCRLDNFSMSFILYYVSFSICENKWISINMREKF